MTTMDHFDVFLAEDNPADVSLVHEAFTYYKYDCRVHVMKDGEIAAAFLKRIGPELPCPDIAIIDLNMPKVDGEELIRLLRSNSACAGIPVLVMTSSRSPKDLAMIAGFGAAYFHKPINLSEYLKVAEVVADLVAKDRNDNNSSQRARAMP
jgi:DNA-binding response OmpR family regulator